MPEPHLPRLFRDMRVDTPAQLARIRGLGEPLALLVKLYTLYHPRHSMCSSAEDLPLRFFISLATGAVSPSGLGSVSLYQSTGRDSIPPEPSLEPAHRAGAQDAPRSMMAWV